MQRFHEYRDGCEPDDDGEWVYYDEATAEITRLEAELARAKELAVWAVQHEAEISFEADGSWTIDSYSEPSFPLTCTPAGILAALETAKENSK